MLWFAGSAARGWLRILITLPLLLSPYFWQSALWMLNDDATLLFAFLAFVTVLRRSESVRAQWITGLLLAAAIATRQTYIWAIVPVAAVLLVETQGQSARSRTIAVARVAVPPLVVLAGLVIVWHGFVPPPFRVMNAGTQSWVSVSYCAAVAAMFLGPLLLALGRRRAARAHIAVCVAAITAAPAWIFQSVVTEPPNDARRGGLIWSLVSHGPSVMDRSLVLAVLAALGGWIICHVIAELPRREGVMLAMSLAALAITLWAGLQLHQKYFGTADRSADGHRRMRGDHY